MKAAKACAFVCLLMACGVNREPLSTRLAAAKVATIPAGVQLIDSPAPIRKDMSFLAEWAFEATGDWTTYANHAASLLEADHYTRTTVADGILCLSNHTPGDVFSVRIERRSSPPLRVRVTFHALPD
jgi:hypothetical protein